jgi:hypothetical protein
MFTGESGTFPHRKLFLLTKLSLILLIRWRKLSGIDPDKAELLSKVQTLQKFVLIN